MRVNEIKLALGESESLLLEKAIKKANASAKYKFIKILKKSLDARDKGDIKYVYSVELTEEQSEEKFKFPFVKNPPYERVIVVGSGPCGLMCALELARCGISVLVLERGEAVERRAEKVKKFNTRAVLDPESNVQFGEGGAGTFSDGKLNTASGGFYVRRVLENFVAAGAPSEIVYLNKPHVGSDKLPDVVKNIRKEIEALGGEIRFGSKLINIIVKNGAISAAILESGEEIPVSELVIAIGHSARDTFKSLYGAGVAMQNKDFAVGVRIEHLQHFIDVAQYGSFYAGKLPAADYKLTSSAYGRGVYTFCMCPGGTLVAASSEEGMLAINGMSNYARAGINANSAVIVQVGAKDYGEELFSGMNFQRELECKSFAAVGGYNAPVQLLGDFLSDKESVRFGEVSPTYPIGTGFYPIRRIFGEQITNCLKSGILQMDSKLKGFASAQAVLTAPETRTSSPVRILRGENLQSINISGLYPAGEGCGYAGGIASAGADGIKVAERIIKKYS